MLHEKISQISAALPKAEPFAVEPPANTAARTHPSSPVRAASLHNANGKCPRWTPEDDAELRRLAEADASALEIGVAMHRSRSAICGRAARLGIHLGWDRPSRVRASTPRVRDGQAETREAILNMWFAGTDKSQIMRDLGVTDRQIVWCLKRARKRGDHRAVYVTERHNLIARSYAAKPDHYCGEDITFQDAMMEGLCRWFRPSQSGLSGHVCGHLTYLGQSYCKHHKVISCDPRARPHVIRLMELAERNVA